MNPEEIRRALEPVRPKRELLRAIPAFVPFTAAEGETLRKGLFEHDTHWIFVPDGDRLELWRDYYGDVSFFWRMEFEVRGGTFILTCLHTIKENTKGEFFASDRNQIGAAWSLLESIVLRKKTWHQEDFYWGAEQLLARARGAADPLKLKEEIWADMIRRAEERMGPGR